MKSLKLLTGCIFLIITLLLFSCKPQVLPREKETVTITRTIKEVKRDTIVKIAADSSYFEAFIECQNGKPIMKQNPNSNKNTAGKNLQTPRVDLDGHGKIKITCESLMNELKITLREKSILEEKLNEKTIVPPPVLIEKQLSWWQALWIKLGKILGAGLIIFILTKIPWKAFLRL